MALNATLGASDANSYVTLEEADAYFEDRMHSSAWDTAENPEALLITASQMLDWYIKWKGSKSTASQFMQWPRSGAIRSDGTEIDDDVLPPEVKIAVFEQAFANIEADRTLEDPLAGIGKLKAGSLAIEAGPEKPNQTNAKPVANQVYNILKDLYNSGVVVRLLRA